MQLGKIQIAVLFLILANIIWGASFPIYKWSLENIPPFSFSFLRFYIGALIILPFVYKNLYIEKGDRKKLIITSLFSVTFLIPLLFLGLTLAPSINAPIIIASGPIFILIASVIFLKEKLKLKTLVGTIISLIGVLLIVVRPLLETGISGGLIGNLLFFLATMCSVVQAIMLRKIMVRNNPLTVTFWMFLIGSLPLIPFFIWESSNFSISEINSQGAIGLIYGIVFAAVLAHYFLIYGLKYIKASSAGIFTYVDPIATVIVAVPLLNETVSITYVIAAMLVFLGIFIAQNRLPYHPFKKLFN